MAPALQRTTYLLASFDQALAWKKELAANPERSSLGCQVTTPAAWVEGLWELYGDGRRFVSAGQRVFLVMGLLEGQGVLPATMGTARLIARFLAEAVGTRGLETSRAACPGEPFSQAEQAVVELAHAYGERLRQLGLVERGMALAALAPEMPREHVVLVGEHHLPSYLDEFLHSPAVGLACEGVAPDEPIGRLPEGVEPRVLVPSGPSAQDRMLLDALLANAACGQRTLVAAPNPFDLYQRLRGGLLRGGASASVVARIPVARTRFGRALTCAAAIMGGTAGAAAVLDFLLSPYAGVPSGMARAVQARIRGNRALSPSDICQMVGQACEAFGHFDALLGGDDEERARAWESLASIARGAFCADPAILSEELAAIGSLRSLWEQIEPLGASAADLPALLDDLNVSCSRTSAPEGSPATVAFVEARRGASVEERSFAHVVLADPSDVNFPAAPKVTALDVLAGKLGIELGGGSLREQRAACVALQRAATHSFAIVLTRTGGDGAEVYPAFFVQEYFDAYREPGEEDVDDAPFGMPAAFASRVAQRGEEHLVGNADRALEAAPTAAIAAREAGRLDGRAIEGLLEFANVGGKRLPVLSPSQIEKYMSCPYAWFLERKIGAEGLDEQFGPLETGSFVHGVFEAFYRRFLNTEPRVVPENLVRAQELLGQVFDERLAAQRDAGPGRYLPVSGAEAVAAERLRQQLLDSLAVQARLFEGFVPADFERAITTADEVVYAGACIQGRIDRLECDASRTRWIVLDYKGGVTGRDAGYDPDAKPKGSASAADEAESSGPAPFECPSTVQALIYASALRVLEPASSVVGALYLSYRASDPRKALAGSFNPTAAGLELCAGKKSEVRMSFDAYLDLVEEHVAPFVARMVAGDIAPAPRSKDACTYCLAFDCPRRLA